MRHSVATELKINWTNTAHRTHPSALSHYTHTLLWVECGFYVKTCRVEKSRRSCWTCTCHHTCRRLSNFISWLLSTRAQDSRRVWTGCLVDTMFRWLPPLLPLLLHLARQLDRWPVTCSWRLKSALKRQLLTWRMICSHIIWLDIREYSTSWLQNRWLLNTVLGTHFPAQPKSRYE